MKDSGLSPALIAGNKVILSGIFTTALNDQITFLHPCKGVKTPTVPVKPFTIITPEQFSTVYDALPDPMWRLLAETDIESGLRWGERPNCECETSSSVPHAHCQRTLSSRYAEVDRLVAGLGGQEMVPKDWKSSGAPSW